jgi:hypothetical protein
MRLADMDLNIRTVNDVTRVNHVEHPSKTTLGLFRLAELPKLRQFLPYLELMEADNSPSLSLAKPYERVLGEFPTAGEEGIS